MATRRRVELTALVLGVAALVGSMLPAEAAPAPVEVAGVDVLTLNGGRVDWSPDGSHVAFDRQGSRPSQSQCYDTWTIDLATMQETCLTCNYQALGLPAGNKGQPAWHPDGRWLVIQVESRNNPGPQCNVTANPGSGVYNDLWMIRADGSEAVPLRQLEFSSPRSGTVGTDGRGTLHPHFDRQGKRLVWSEYIRGRCNVQDTPFYPADTCANEDFRNGSGGHWVVAVANVSYGPDGRPELDAPTTFQPGVRAFYETHGFTHDGKGILLSGNPDRGQPMLGMDVMVIDAATGAVTRRVTDTPGEWDEHAHFPPCRSETITFSSSRGYTNEVTIHTVGTLNPPPSDLWLDVPGRDQRRLTFFNEPSWPHRPPGISDRLFLADNTYSPDGRRIAALLLETNAVGTYTRTSAVVIIELTRSLCAVR